MLQIAVGVGDTDVEVLADNTSLLLSIVELLDFLLNDADTAPSIREFDLRTKKS
jgi:hypothetical protein